MHTWHIHIQGQVQGVGFRPYIYLLAEQFNLNGWVNNDIDGVHIEINATEKQAEEFQRAILHQRPELSCITSIQTYPVTEKRFDEFRIEHSANSGSANLLITPDFTLCKDCLHELNDPSNHRCGYSFITCTNCGPRYSIIKQLPYDRENTSMDAFQMCSSCNEEYQNPRDRRYYSQTNSCPDCAISLKLYTPNKDLITQDPNTIIEQIIHNWASGKIVAIKGIGGYLLTCSANHENAINTLRKRKHRPSKPFALMYPSVNDLSDFLVTPREREALTSPVAPIVLLEKTNAFQLPEVIAPSLDSIGVMLPYAPLFKQLLDAFNCPIVATSANISNSPIVYQDENALSALAPIADCVVAHNREIVIPQDDSVLKYSKKHQQKIVLRRSRGLAPTFLRASSQKHEQSFLAMGAMLKSTFAVLHQGNTYISQYLGDLEHFDTLRSYQNSLDHFMQLLEIQPSMILLDKHEGYPSSQYAQLLAEQLNVTTFPVQHHIAHFGAILGEHNLEHSNEAILGFIWDGTGLGDDGHIWGGECFKYINYTFTRVHHIDYFNYTLGDKMAKEPRIAAFSVCRDLPEAISHLREKFSATEWKIYHALFNKDKGIKTSSIGRLFDAVASLLGILDKQTYEGEAAQSLEVIATRYFQKNGFHFEDGYFDTQSIFDQPLKTIIKGILKDLNQNKPQDYIAAKFHYSLVQYINSISRNQKIRRLAFSGGVFQNGLLIDLIIYHLQKDYTLYLHEQLSPNDENISFGQLISYTVHRHKLKTKKESAISLPVS